MPVDRFIIIRIALAGAFYYLGAKIGVTFTFTFTVTSDGVAILWPPNAVLLAALLSLPKTHWPLLFVVILIAECLADYPVFPWPMALGFGVVNIAEACFACFLIRRYIGSSFGFETLSSTMRFFLLVPLFASSVAALGGASVYYLAGSSDASFLLTWRLWWFGDAVGLAVLTPLFISASRQWSAQGVGGFFQVERKRLRELILLWLGLLSVGALSLMGKQSEALTFYITPILLLPFAIWAAVRFTTLMASLVVAFVASFTVAYLLQGHQTHPFLAPEVSVWQMQEYLVTICVITLGLSSLTRQFERQQDLLRLQGRAMMSSNDAITIADARANDFPIVWVNSRFRALFGYDEEEIIGKNCRFLQDGMDNTKARQTIRESLANGTSCRVLLRNLSKNRVPLWIELSLSPVRDRHGDVTHFVGIQHDVTEEKETRERLTEAENQLIRQNLELEAKVAERTQSLADANEELSELNERLRNMASTDYLTGIANRRHFFEVGARELKRCLREAGSVLLIALDIDHFKQINDQHGHEAGDAVLKEVIDPVKNAIRPTDLFGRVGGEEFLILMTDAGTQPPEDIAERIRRQVSGLEVNYQGTRLHVTVSIGVAIWDRYSDLKTLARFADAALYEAKKAGRNCVRVTSISGSSEP